jgi:hypothetical protein
MLLRSGGHTPSQAGDAGGGDGQAQAACLKAQEIGGMRIAEARCADLGRLV